jgi:hypothetical protein
MNELLTKAVIFLSVGVLMFWLWRRIFRGTGRTILLIAWLMLAVISFFSFEAVEVLLWVFLILLLLYEGWRIVAFPKYVKASAAFETNQILRGLSPAEAAFFVGLDKQDVFIVALLNLLDKGILRLKRDTGRLVVSLTDEYRLKDSSISPDERTSSRLQIARANDQVLHPYEDVLIELISSNDSEGVSELNFEIWYQYLDNDLRKLAGVYDFQQTSEYTRNIVEKMADPDSAYSAGKRNLSAWKAIRLFDRGRDGLNEHRPDWLAPDDGFSSVVFELRK